eukprot:2406531-Karenia_brevis.AAC.1
MEISPDSGRTPPWFLRKSSCPQAVIADALLMQTWSAYRGEADPRVSSDLEAIWSITLCVKNSHHSLTMTTTTTMNNVMAMMARR